MMNFTMVILLLLGTAEMVEGGKLWPPKHGKPKDTKLIPKLGNVKDKIEHFRVILKQIAEEVLFIYNTTGFDVVFLNIYVSNKEIPPENRTSSKIWFDEFHIQYTINEGDMLSYCEEIRSDVDIIFEPFKVGGHQIEADVFCLLEIAPKISSTTGPEIKNGNGVMYTFLFFLVLILIIIGGLLKNNKLKNQEKKTSNPISYDNIALVSM